MRRGLNRGLQCRSATCQSKAINFFGAYSCRGTAARLVFFMTSVTFGWVVRDCLFSAV